MIQGKLGSLVGRSSGYIESLPVSVRRRVAGLKGIQKEHAKLEAQFQEEVLELEKKYFAKFTPLYQRRSTIVNGAAEPTDGEVEAGQGDEEDVDSKDDAEATKEEDQESQIAGIPEFWLSAMKNQISLAEMITERDEEALKHLVDIRMEYLDRPGFRLIFEFSENAYFTNKTISKTYYYKEENGYGGDFIYDHAEGTKIDWKAEKDLTVRIESKKQRNKSEYRDSIYQMCTVADVPQIRNRPGLSKLPSPRSHFSTSSPPLSPRLTMMIPLLLISRSDSSLIISSVKTSRRSSSPEPLTGSRERPFSSKSWVTTWMPMTTTTRTMKMRMKMMKTMMMRGDPTGTLTMTPMKRCAFNDHRLLIPSVHANTRTGWHLEAEEGGCRM